MNRTVYSSLLSGYTTSLESKEFLGFLQENTGRYTQANLGRFLTNPHLTSNSWLQSTLYNDSSQ